MSTLVLLLMTSGPVGADAVAGPPCAAPSWEGGGSWSEPCCGRRSLLGHFRGRFHRPSSCDNGPPSCAANAGGTTLPATGPAASLPAPEPGPWVEHAPAVRGPVSSEPPVAVEDPRPARRLPAGAPTLNEFP